MFFFFNDTATTEIYPLSLRDALPICADQVGREGGQRRRQARRAVDSRAGRRARIPRSAADRRAVGVRPEDRRQAPRPDRKSTRLNSSHANISYAVFCLKKKIIVPLSN